MSQILQGQKRIKLAGHPDPVKTFHPVCKSFSFAVTDSVGQKICQGMEFMSQFKLVTQKTFGKLKPLSIPAGP